MKAKNAEPKVFTKLVMPQECGTTVRTTHDDKDRFNEYRANEGVTQHVFFSMLLDHWAETMLNRKAS